jgi:serine protease Do
MGRIHLKVRNTRMNRFRYSNLAGLGVLFLILGSAPGALPGQSPNQTPTKPATPAAPAPPSADVDRQCQDLDVSAERMEQLAGEIDHEMQGKLAGLQAELAEKTQILSAQLQSKEAELQVHAKELSARAQELAARMQDKMPQLLAQERGMSMMSMEEGGGWLGIGIGEVTPEKTKELKLSSERGVVVGEVEPDSPAAKAGLRANDVITQYDGQTVEGTVQFMRLVHETPSGRTVTLTIWRDGASQNVSVEIGDRSSFLETRVRREMGDGGQAFTFAMPRFNMPNVGPDMMGMMDPHTPALGINGEDLSGQLGGYFGAPDGKGVLVREVRTGTPAEKAGLMAGDVIIKLDGKPVRTLQELREGLRSASGDKPVNIGILRKGSEMNISATIEKPHPPAVMRMTHSAQL